MAKMDAATRQRLERLRATDTTGLYASDQPTEASDPAGAVTATVDPTLRVLRVQVNRLEAVRTPAALTEAFEAAYRAALSRRVRRSEDRSGSSSAARPVARRIRRISPAPTPELLDRHETRYRDRGLAPARRRGEVVGTSRNECVSVTLPAANPRGLLDVDPGWLAVTTRSRLSGAITEAFADAYARRDQP